MRHLFKVLALAVVIGLICPVSASLLLRGAAALGLLNSATYSLAQTAGVDITGAADSAAGLNTLFTTICAGGGGTLANKVVAPANSKIKINSTVSVTNCNTPLLIDLAGAMFSWGGAAHGVMFTVDGTQFLVMQNVKFETNGVADVALDIDQNHGGITNDDKYENIRIDNGLGLGLQSSSFVGIRLGKNATSNIDRQEFEHVLIYCGDAPGGGVTASSNGYGVALPDGSQAQPFWVGLHNFQGQNCSSTFYVGSGTNTTEWNIDGGYGGGNFHELVVKSGRSIHYRNIHEEDVAEIPIVDSGALMLEVTGNDFDGLTSGHYIEISNGAGVDVITNNIFNGGTSTPVVTTASVSTSIILKNNAYRAGSSCFDVTTLSGFVDSAMNMPQSGGPCPFYNNGLPTSCSGQPSGAQWNNTSTHVLSICP